MKQKRKRTTHRAIKPLDSTSWIKRATLITILALLIFASGYYISISPVFKNIYGQVTMYDYPPGPIPIPEQTIMNLTSCGVTLNASTDYQLTKDIIGTPGGCFHINSSDVTLNGNGHSIIGVEGSGTGITIEDLNYIEVAPSETDTPLSFQQLIYVRTNTGIHTITFNTIDPNGDAMIRLNDNLISVQQGETYTLENPHISITIKETSIDTEYQWDSTITIFTYEDTPPSDTVFSSPMEYSLIQDIDISNMNIKGYQEGISAVQTRYLNIENVNIAVNDSTSGIGLDFTDSEAIDIENSNIHVKGNIPALFALNSNVKVRDSNISSDNSTTETPFFTDPALIKINGGNVYISETTIQQQSTSTPAIISQYSSQLRVSYYNSITSNHKGIISSDSSIYITNTKITSKETGIQIDNSYYPEISSVDITTFDGDGNPSNDIGINISRIAYGFFEDITFKTNGTPINLNSTTNSNNNFRTLKATTLNNQTIQVEPTAILREQGIISNKITTPEGTVFNESSPILLTAQIMTSPTENKNVHFYIDQELMKTIPTDTTTTYSTYTYTPEQDTTTIPWHIAIEDNNENTFELLPQKIFYVDPTPPTINIAEPYQNLTYSYQEEPNQDVPILVAQSLYSSLFRPVIMELNKKLPPLPRNIQDIILLPLQHGDEITIQENKTYFWYTSSSGITSQKIPFIKYTMERQWWNNEEPKIIIAFYDNEKLLENETYTFFTESTDIFGRYNTTNATNIKINKTIELTLEKGERFDTGRNYVELTKVNVSTTNNTQVSAQISIDGQTIMVEQGKEYIAGSPTANITIKNITSKPVNQSILGGYTKLEDYGTINITIRPTNEILHYTNIQTNQTNNTQTNQTTTVYTQTTITNATYTPQTPTNSTTIESNTINITVQSNTNILTCILSFNKTEYIMTTSEEKNMCSITLTDRKQGIYFYNVTVIPNNSTITTLETRTITILNNHIQNTTNNTAQNDTTLCNTKIPDNCEIIEPIFLNGNTCPILNCFKYKQPDIKENKTEIRPQEPPTNNTKTPTPIQESPQKIPTTQIIMAIVAITIFISAVTLLTILLIKKPQQKIEKKTRENQKEKYTIYN